MIWVFTIMSNNEQNMKLTLYQRNMIISMKKHYHTHRFGFILVLLISSIICTQAYSKQQVTKEPEDFFDMSIEELMNVEIISPASLTKTTRRLTPATVTTVTQDEIRTSGARSLNELLEIYVPYRYGAQTYQEHDSSCGWLQLIRFDR